MIFYQLMACNILENIQFHKLFQIISQYVSHQIVLLNTRLVILLIILNNY